ncbi:MAG: hypothetical protein ABI459_11205, partial [Deltaproteobacteria bacterium]
MTDVGASSAQVNVDNSPFSITAGNDIAIQSVDKLIFQFSNNVLSKGDVIVAMVGILDEFKGMY